MIPMMQSDTLSFNVKWNYKTTGMLMALIVLPELLGVVNVSVASGFKLHFFQAGIFLAAAVYGPWGGLASGFAGSFLSAYVMGNPYLLIGNALLGFCTGLFLRKGFRTVPAVWLAYAIQLPWLIITDYYLVHLPAPFIRGLVIALFLSNTLWAAGVHYLVKPVKRFLSC
ncbi:MAG: ECF transporter S component [Deltaproteobacteria bacterium]|nr:ECF transporter S component [Deltaproteobacteria bacterium]